VNSPAKESKENTSGLQFALFLQWLIQNLLLVEEHVAKAEGVAAAGKLKCSLQITMWEVLEASCNGYCGLLLLRAARMAL
jgi:hypothetical protein